jgi:hypothetical protein
MLPKSAWLDNYYLPMETELFELNKKYSGDKEASAIFDAMQKEIDFYKKFCKFFGYEFFIMQKTG